jgi:hypothetical protein
VEGDAGSTAGICVLEATAGELVSPAGSGATGSGSTGSGATGVGATGVGATGSGATGVGATGVGATGSGAVDSVSGGAPTDDDPGPKVR